MAAVLESLEAKLEAPSLVWPCQESSFGFGDDEPFPALVAKGKAVLLPDPVDRLEVHPV
jgi:hypothetical protein